LIGKALERPAFARQTRASTRQQGHLGVFALNRRIRLPVRLNGQGYAHELAILNNADTICILGRDLSGKSCADLHTTRLNSLHEPVMEIAVAHNAAQLRDVKVAMTNHSATESTFLRNVNSLYLSGLGRPRTQGLEEYTAAMIECEDPWVIFWCVPIWGSLTRLQKCDPFRMDAVAGQ
jgi:hypothetical protein